MTGGYWHSLQLNLPYTFHARFSSSTAMTLFSGPMGGRSGFWMTSLHCARFTKATLPKPSSSSRKSATRIQRSTNPRHSSAARDAHGAETRRMVRFSNYVLKDRAKLVTLEILDAAGKLVRRFSSDDKPEPFDAKRHQCAHILGAAGVGFLPATGGKCIAGAWNLRYPRPKTMESDYPISAIPHDTPVGPPRACSCTRGIQRPADCRWCGANAKS